MGGGGDALGVWDGNSIKLGCDDRSTTINAIKFIELKTNKRYPLLELSQFLEPSLKYPMQTLLLFVTPTYREISFPGYASSQVAVS